MTLTPTREQVFAALFQLSTAVQWSQSPSGFAFSSRRVKLWTDVPAQPALLQAEHDEQFGQSVGYPAKRVFGATWIVYHQAGADAAAVPTTETNNILDAIDCVFAPDDPTTDRLTLGGLVQHAWIEGRVTKDPGDLDGQALLVVPIKILVP